LGILDPFETFKVVKFLIDKVGIDIEMHTHNDFGMATANALAGVEAGAKYFNTTVNGLGERAGNAALEEVVMAMKYIGGMDLAFKTTMFRQLSEYVAAASARTIPVWKAIVGANVFAHESGIHADGVIKNPITYEVFAPEEVGLERQIVIGKHSGTRALMAKFKEYGVELNEDDASEILRDVRAKSIQEKRALFDKELVQIYKKYVARKKA